MADGRDVPSNRDAVSFFVRHPVPILVCLVFALVLPWRPEVASLYNLETLLMATVLLAVLAIGQATVMITGGIDLSLPAVISLCSVAGGMLIAEGGPVAGSSLSAPVAVCTMLGVGLVVGGLQGAAVAYLKMPAFLVSLSMLMLLGGVALWVTGSARYPMPEQFTRLWYGRLAGVPLPSLVVLALAAFVHFLLAHTLFGRRLFAIGQNAAAAQISGLPVERTLVSAYMMSGFCSALASVFYSARLHSASPELVETDVLLDCIAAAVIGGTSLFGGKGSVAGVLVGAIFIALVGNSLNLLGLRYWHVLIVKGAVILLAMALDAVSRRVAEDQ